MLRPPSPVSPPYLLFSTAPPTTETYTLSLHDALPISSPSGGGSTSPPTTASTAGNFGPITACCPLSSGPGRQDRKSTRLNSSHVKTSYAVFCLKKKTQDLRSARCSRSPASRPHPDCWT